MPISEKYKCLFVHIPKTGGTSIETALGMFADWEKENLELLFGLIQSPEIKKRGFISNFLQHLTLDQAITVHPTCKIYISFSFVRNPWDKMVSIYSNPDNNLLIEASRQGIELNNLSFEDFIIQTRNIRHIHLEHQHKFICDQNGKLQVDFLGKFETIAEDFQRLCKLLAIKNSLPHYNRSTRTDYRNYYTDPSRKIIEERYARDIELFGYSF